MIRTRMNRSDWLILLFLALIWGGAFFCIDIAVRTVPPLTYVALRLTIASGAMWAYLRLNGKAAGLPRESWGALLLLALLNNVLPFLLIGWGEIHIASGLAAILNATTPIFGVVVAHFMTKDERMSLAKLAGVLLGFVGVALMVGPSMLSRLGSSGLAEIACLVASLSYALAAVWARRFKRMGVSPLAITTGQLTAGALFTVPLALVMDHPWNGPLPSLGALAAIAALALACTAFAYVLYFRLIEQSGATNALLVTLVVPPIAIVLGGLFLGETLSALDFAGLALIALGLGAIDGRIFRISFLGSLPRAASLRPGSSNPGPRRSARLPFHANRRGSTSVELRRRERPKEPFWGPDRTQES